MAEQTGQERNLPPTEKRLADAKREGQVPRSRDLAHLLLLGGAGAALFALSRSLSESGQKIVASSLTFDALVLAEPATMAARLGEMAWVSLLQLLPLLATVFVAAMAAPLAVGGWLFAPSLLQVKGSRLNPLSGFRRLFSLAALVDLTKVMLVALLLAAVGGSYVYTHVREIAQLAHEGLPAAVSHFGTLLALGFALLVATLAASASIDVPFQIYHHRSKLKMTLEEVRRENKETEGDPHVKARVRSVQREMARRRMMAAVPDADVVVTNPTHFAVALKYVEGRHAAPVVVAKGADAVAERIRELASAHGVPRLEAPALARALHRHVDLGGEIPAALYHAVAQVLAYVFQLRRFAEGRGERPLPPERIEVPAELDPLAPQAAT